LALFIASVAAAPASLAQTRGVASPAVRVETAGPPWAALTSEQQTALAPLKRDWNSIDANRKEKWLELASRFAAMPETERQRVQERMTEWANLSPEERGRARLRYQEARSLKPQDRRERWDAYQTLPPEQRRALASRAQSTAPSGGARNDGSAAVAGRGPGAAPPQDKAAVKAVAPAVVQAKPGASTTLISNAPPAGKPGPEPPKSVAAPGQVDRQTLLPQVGTPASAGRGRP
jgi:hypothetical protein